MEYVEFMLKHGPRCRLCVRRGPINRRGYCETCRVINGELFKIQRLYGGEVLAGVAKLLRLDLGGLAFCGTTIAGLKDGAFRCSPEAWGTRAYETRMEREIRAQIRGVTRDFRIKSDANL